MEKSNKVKFTVEYEFRASPHILYEFLTSPSLLAQWFADHCDITERVYSFFWNGYEEKAVAEVLKENECVRLRWEDDDDKMIEFRLAKIGIASATLLTIIDSIEDGEQEDQQLLWDSQISTLRTLVGG